MARKTVTNHPSDITASAPGAGEGANTLAFGTEDALARMAGQERRLHARAYHHWASLLGAARFPTIHAFDTGAAGDFAGNSVLLDFRGNRADAVIAHIGTALREECGIDGELPGRIADIPAHSLLARLTAHCDQILAEQAPAGFEAEFVNERGHTILYRGILLPYSSDGLMIDFVHGVVSWKEVADPCCRRRSIRPCWIRSRGRTRPRRRAAARVCGRRTMRHVGRAASPPSWRMCR
ncbi:hypothetical protein P0F65_14940 [Sphingomonas sp. I4]